MMLNSVEEFFKKRRKTVEKYNEDKILDLGWEYPDVLYSFKGVYAIGVFIFYRHLFKNNIKTDIILKDKESKRRQLLYSDKFLREHYTEFFHVNELKEMKTFLQHYYDIGNVIPTWPGANISRGMAHCYDIPNVYYKTYNKFTNLIFKNIYVNSFLDIILKENEYDTVAKLLGMNKKEYVEFLKYITEVIITRNNLLGEL